jgi:hypothetical protein
LTICPKCEAEVGDPFKTWAISRRSSKPGGTPTVFGMYACPECGKRFRARVRSGRKEEVSIKGVTRKIKGIEVELMSTLKNLREKLKTLETERANLLLEIGELKKMAEAKATALESEIGMLREEVESLKQLLGVNELET